MKTKVLQAPPDVSASIDRISGEDRDWFNLHPLAAERTRPAAEHEFWPNFDSACVKYVIVREVCPGFRFRTPVLRLHLSGTERVQ